jgi:hypothetical protein
MTEQKKNVHESISRLLTKVLSKYETGDVSLNLATCVGIYQDIFDTLVETLQEANVKLTNEGMNYLAQMYYDAVSIKSKGNMYELDPNIFNQRAKLENIATKELTLLAMMLNGTDFAVPIIKEVKRRS